MFPIFTKRKFKTNMQSAILNHTVSIYMGQDGHGLWKLMAKITERGYCTDHYMCLLWNVNCAFCFATEGDYPSMSEAVNDMVDKMYRWYRVEMWPKHPGESIRRWHMRVFPDDPNTLGLDDIPFYEYLMEKVRTGTYYTCGVDNELTVKRIKAALEEVMHWKDENVFIPY